MLHLAAPTAPDWIERAASDLETLLLDHAHCEKKAASTAMNLVFRYTDVAVLARPLSEIAREELEHFELLLGVLDRRGIAFRRLPPSRYAERLVGGTRDHEPARLLDTLVCCALIEARSCERMGLLAEGLDDPDLRDLYGSLLESEARHHATYLDLARATGLFEETEVRERTTALADHEAAVLADLPTEVRFHNR